MGSLRFSVFSLPQPSKNGLDNLFLVKHGCDMFRHGVNRSADLDVKRVCRIRLKILRGIIFRGHNQMQL